jgi:hypothetical protein
MRLIGYHEIINASGFHSMEDYIPKLTAFLTSPLPNSLLAGHPNEAAMKDFWIPPEWQDWWDWAGHESNPTQTLLDFNRVRSTRNILSTPAKTALVKPLVGLAKRSASHARSRQESPIGS